MRNDRGVEFLMIEILALIAACGCGSVSIVATLNWLVFPWNDAEQRARYRHSAVVASLMLSVCMIKLLKGGI